MVWAADVRGAIAVMSTAKMKQMGFIPRTRRNSRPVVCLQALRSTRREGMAVHLAFTRPAVPRLVDPHSGHFLPLLLPEHLWQNSWPQFLQRWMGM